MDALRHIVCPIDFSTASQHALEQAVALARPAGARLTVLHVFLSVMPGTGLSAVDVVTSQLIEPADLQALRDRVADAARPAIEAGVPFDVAVVGGAPVPRILEQAAAGGADLIVMGTHGTSGVQHLILGSVAEKVLRKASCPVLTVPPRAVGTPASAFGHVLCAVDFSECSRQAVATVTALGPDADLRVTLLHVMEWPWHEPPIPGMEGLAPAQVEALLEYRRYLETSAADGLKAMAAAVLPGHRVETLVRFGKPYRELLDVAREQQVDLIALGVRGRGAVDIGFFGSTTNHVVRSAACPVLTVCA